MFVNGPLVYIYVWWDCDNPIYNDENGQTENTAAHQQAQSDKNKWSFYWVYSGLLIWAWKWVWFMNAIKFLFETNMHAKGKMNPRFIMMT